jgi:hypothetical protein
VVLLLVDVIQASGVSLLAKDCFFAAALLKNVTRVVYSK